MPPNTDQRCECERLEAYLDGDSSKQDDEQFATHLANCAACRSAVEQQQWLDNILRNSVSATTTPAEALAGIDRAITRTRRITRRRRRRLAGSLAALTAAASLLVAVSLRQPQHATTSNSQLTTLDSQPVATFVGSDDMIVIQHESPYPNVTIVEVFPTISAQRRLKNAATPSYLPTPQQIPGDPS